MTCPNYSINGKLMKCSLIDGKMFPAEGKPHNPCIQCQTEWTDGPPTCSTFTPTLVRLTQWDVSQPSRGLGDLIAKATHALGIEQKPGCGCAKRQAALNKAIPFQSTGASGE